MCSLWLLILRKLQQNQQGRLNGKMLGCWSSVNTEWRKFVLSPESGLFRDVVILNDVQPDMWNEAISFVVSHGSSSIERLAIHNLPYCDTIIYHTLHDITTKCSRLIWIRLVLSCGVPSNMLLNFCYGGNGEHGNGEHGNGGMIYTLIGHSGVLGTKGLKEIHM